MAIEPGTAVQVACSGCGERVPVAFPTRCPRAAGGDDTDHVLTRRLDLGRVSLTADDDPNPFVRYRQMFRAWHVARAAGWSDLVHRLDRAVIAVDGRGFRITPFQRADALSYALGFSAEDGVWVKDETNGVAGSHKARHLMGIMLELLVAEAVDPTLEGRPLAIASCGNAALAAAVVAHAAGRRLDVFVPPEADPAILELLGRFHARIELVRRPPGRSGDPTVRRLHAAIVGGAIPFTCQGPDNGLAIEGGQTLGFEIAETVAREAMTLDRIVIQVGGGGLASACAQGLAEAHALGILASLPRLDTVQTAGAWPLRRAYERIAAELQALDIDTSEPVDLGRPNVRAVLDAAAHRRSRYMWPWETEPRSVAHGILDDETYDWRAVVEAMLATGGRPIVVDEPTLLAANELARRTTGTDADETGTSGLAGLIDLLGGGAVGRDERVAVLFTGIRRGSPAADRSTE
jgi:threonine synthase